MNQNHTEVNDHLIFLKEILPLRPKALGEVWLWLCHKPHNGSG